LLVVRCGIPTTPNF